MCSFLAYAPVDKSTPSTLASTNRLIVKYGLLPPIHCNAIVLPVRTVLQAACRIAPKVQGYGAEEAADSISYRGGA
jgi:hypothetical protein